MSDCLSDFKASNSTHDIRAIDWKVMMASNRTDKFEFIVSTPCLNAAIQADKRTLVRQHVMRRFMKAKRRPRAVVLHEAHLAEYLSHRENSGQFKPENAPVFVTDQFTNDAKLLGAARPSPFAKYPIRMGPEEFELVHHIWGSQQIVFQPFRDYWFTLGMMDPAAMNLVLANAALHRKALKSSKSNDMIVLLHGMHAIKSVNQRIADPGRNITDGMLGAVLGLLCHDLLNLRFDRCALHIDGFSKMIDLRGGINTIEHVPSIRMSVYWIEHNICAALDTVPHFPPPYHLLHSPYSEDALMLGIQHDQEAFAVSPVANLITPQMRAIFKRLSILTVALRRKSMFSISLEDCNFPGFAFYPELYQLLALQVVALDHQDDHEFQELCRLGCLLFLGHVRRGLGISPVVVDHQTEKLRKLLERSTSLWNNRFDTMRRWTLLMAGTAMNTTHERLWVVIMLLSGMNSGLDQFWNTMIGEVSRLWWVDEILIPKSQILRLELELRVNGGAETRV